MTTRREVLVRRKETAVKQVRIQMGQITDPGVRIGALYALELGDLLIDVLIDIAHPLPEIPPQ